jgi:hypothetical protein
LPARFVLRAGKAQTHVYTIKIFYDFSGEGLLEQYPASIYVFDKPTYLYWIIPLALVVIIALFIYFRSKLKGKKDEED